MHVKVVVCVCVCVPGVAVTLSETATATGYGRALPQSQSCLPCPAFPACLSASSPLTHPHSQLNFWVAALSNALVA